MLCVCLSCHFWSSAIDYNAALVNPMTLFTVVQDEMYLYIGRMMALSILHGGPGPVFFAPAIIDYLFDGTSGVKVTIADVPDKHIQSQIRKVTGLLGDSCILFQLVTVIQLNDASDEEEFRTLIAHDDYEFRYSCGISKPTSCITFSDKKQIVDAMCLHHSVLVSLAELEQLRRGLSVQGFDKLMKAFPQLMRKAFQPPVSNITSDYLNDLFVVKFSPKGSNHRETEEAIVMMWILYLQNLEGMCSVVCLCPPPPPPPFPFTFPCSHLAITTCGCHHAYHHPQSCII